MLRGSLKTRTCLIHFKINFRHLDDILNVHNPDLLKCAKQIYLEKLELNNLYVPPIPN